EAAAVLERAVQGGCQDANVLYMLAVAYKRQGKTNEARQALRKIAKPDANVVLQMGLLSLEENQVAQAEVELSRAWSMDQDSYEACYTRLLTRLTLGKVDDCLALIPRAVELLDERGAAKPGATLGEERRFLLVLQALLRVCQKGSSAPWQDPLL